MKSATSKKTFRMLICAAVLITLTPLVVFSPGLPSVGGNGVTHASTRTTPTQGPPSKGTAEWEVVEDWESVKNGEMVGIRAGNGKWVARAVDTEGEVGTAEKIWQVRVKREHWSFKSWAGTYLGLNRETKMVAHARTVSKETKWVVKNNLTPPHITLIGVGRDGAGKHAGLSNKGKADLSCKYEELSHPTTTFTLYRPTHCDSPDSCWSDFISEKKEAYQPLDPKDHLGGVLPLFGSPKPLNKSSPSYEEAKTIFERVLTGWTRLPAPVKPLFFMEKTDELGLGMVEETKLPVVTRFEHHKEYKTQPTYRDLFKKTFSEAKDLLGTEAEMGVYSNSDILFTSGLTETLAVSMKYAKKKHAGNPRLMVVGMRVNVVMPSEVDFGTTERELDEVLEKLGGTGKTYQTNAEDYFAVSKGLFEWGKLPDFIVGGVAFDNWFVGKANRDKNNAIVVDASDTILAVHQNHGVGRKDSHLQPKSQYNRNLAVKHGSWSKGRVVDASHATFRTPWGEVVVVERRRLLF